MNTNGAENQMTQITEQDKYNRLRDRPGHLIRRLHQIHVAIFLEECSDFNLTPVQFGVLNVLAGGKVLEQVAIASRIGIDRNNAADVIRRLESRGLLKRPESTKDKRAKLARITEKGRELVDAVFPAMAEAQRRFVEPLTDSEYSRLMELMEKLVVGNNAASRVHWRIDGDQKPEEATTR